MSSPLPTSSLASAVGATDRAEPAGEVEPSEASTLNVIPFNPDLEVSFACPECEHTCLVLWEHLALGMECPACNSSFHILPDRLQKREHRGPAEISFHCPRCKQWNSILASRASQGATCRGCQLELLPGPDKKLYDRQELNQIKLQARQQSNRSHASDFAGFDSDKIRLNLLVGGTTLGLILLFWLGTWFFHTPTVEELAHDFTEYCLTGDASSAAAFVAAEDHQQQEFKHWQMMHFSSLSVAVKNAKDRPNIEVTVVKEEPTQRTLRVEMASVVIGKRTLTQIWQLDATSGAWQFDPVLTLKNLHAAD
jgi:hypothetical protein